LPYEDLTNLKRVLYLGASTGTTVSHLSDILGKKGVIFAVENSQRVARELVENVARVRTNVIPIVKDARIPEMYKVVFGKMDLIYCDIAQPDQTDIAINNCNIYLKEKGLLFLLVKTRSIDVAKNPIEVFRQEKEQLEKSSFTILRSFSLEPFDKDHYFVEAVFHSD
jgi:fibrillarin-like pre-rRNA processing protein